MKWRQAIAIALLSGVVGAAATFGLVKGLSLESLASILVAAGTFVLAYFTWQSVARTGDVIAGEDRRHQQGLAPLLTVQAKDRPDPLGASFTGFRVSNIGYGLAFNIEVNLDAVMDYDELVTVADTDENKEQFAGKFDPANRSVMDLKSYLNVTQHKSKRINRDIVISAMEAKGFYFQIEDEFDGAYNNRHVVYNVALASYQDMFGNHYATKYLDKELDRYEWQQPRHLRIPNPESR